MSSYALLCSPNDWNQKTTQDSIYFIENIPELFGVDKVHEGTCLITFNIINWIYEKYPGIKAKLKYALYKLVSFHGVINTNFNIIMCKDKNT